MWAPTSKGGWENDCFSKNTVSLNSIQILLTGKKGRIYIRKHLIVSVIKPYEGLDTLLDHEGVYTS